MRQPDCILVRTGEQALKSKQVQKRWWAILLNNIRAGLQASNIEFKFETNPNRIFIYTQDIDGATAALKRVFGVTSMSPVWTCHSDLEDINLLAADIAVDFLHLDGTKSFAIRSYRAGQHDFTSHAVAENAGAAVKKVTGARVNLGKPDHEIEIEVRSRNTYVFTSRIQGPGGLPLGTAGQAIALITDDDSAIAAWLIARRGAQLTVLADKKGLAYAEALRKWHYGKKMDVLEYGKLTILAKERKINAVVTGKKIKKGAQDEISRAKLLHFMPTVAFNAEETGHYAEKIGR